MGFREREVRVGGSFVFAIFFVIIIIASLFSFIYTVPAGHRGVLLTFGKPDMIPKDEGIGFKFPFAQKVIKVSVQTLKYEADASAASEDLQIVSTKIAINYHLTADSVPRIYRDYGIDYQGRIIQPAVQEVVKATTAEFKAEELITKRPEVKEDIKEKLKQRLLERDIIVEDISITNFDFSNSFNEAIEAKVTAEQLKLKADRDLERIIIEKEQAITKAQAEAEALRLQKLEVTDNLIELRRIEVNRMAVEKWNGVLPQVTGGALPFLDVDKRIEATN